MQTTVKFLLTCSVLILLIKVSQPQNTVKLKDIMKNSAKFNNNNSSTYANNTNDNDEDVLKNEIDKIKGQCFTSNNDFNTRNSDGNKNQSVYGINYGDNDNGKNYSGGRFNRNDQNSGYGNNRNWGRSDNNGYDRNYGTNQRGYNQYTTSNNNDNPYISYDRNNDGNNQYSSSNNRYPSSTDQYSSSGNNGYQGSNNHYNGNGDVSDYRSNGYDTNRYNGRYNFKNSNNDCRQDYNINKQGGDLGRNNYGYSDHSRAGRINSNGYNTQRTKRSHNMDLDQLDDDQIPSETAFIKWVQDHMKNNDLKRIQTLRQVRKCFGRTATKSIDDGCEYSTELSKCLNLGLE